MTLVEVFLIFWLLPALITWFLVLQNWRKNYKRPERLSADAWVECFMFGLFYPIVLVIVTVDYVKPTLVKERNLWD